jgi:hypothetical protein
LGDDQVGGDDHGHERRHHAWAETLDPGRLDDVEVRLAEDLIAHGLE